MCNRRFSSADCSEISSTRNFKRDFIHDTQCFDLQDNLVIQLRYQFHSFIPSLQGYNFFFTIILGNCNTILQSFSILLSSAFLNTQCSCRPPLFTTRRTVIPPLRRRHGSKCPSFGWGATCECASSQHVGTNMYENCDSADGVREKPIKILMGRKVSSTVHCALPAPCSDSMIWTEPCAGCIWQSSPSNDEYIWSRIKYWEC